MDEAFTVRPAGRAAQCNGDRTGPLTCPRPLPNSRTHWVDCGRWARPPTTLQASPRRAGRLSTDSWRSHGADELLASRDRCACTEHLQAGARSGIRIRHASRPSSRGYGGHDIPHRESGNPGTRLGLLEGLGRRAVGVVLVGPRRRTAGRRVASFRRVPSRSRDSAAGGTPAAPVPRRTPCQHWASELTSPGRSSWPRFTIGPSAIADALTDSSDGGLGIGVSIALVPLSLKGVRSQVR
jgi:hypothetical protein